MDNNIKKNDHIFLQLQLFWSNNVKNYLNYKLNVHHTYLNFILKLQHCRWVVISILGASFAEDGPCWKPWGGLWFHVQRGQVEKRKMALVWKLKPLVSCYHDLNDFNYGRQILDWNIWQIQGNATYILGPTSNHFHKLLLVLLLLYIKSLLISGNEIHTFVLFYVVSYIW